MEASPWLVRQPRAGRRARLFCFSYAGGSAAAFAPWQAVLDAAGIEVCAVQMPGRATRWSEPPCTSMTDLVRALAPVIARGSDLPFAFFGHSLGGLVAFELARFGRLHHLPAPQRLIVSACEPPQHRRPPRGLHRLPDDAFIAELRGYNGTPPEVLQSRELMTLLLPVLRADFELVDGYQYRAGLRLNLPITVLAGQADPHVDRSSVERWGDETTAGCRVRWFDGDHFFIHTQRQAVLEALRAEMAPDRCTA